ncbi:hypothetical protein DY000_02037796 [Brassica cretica]|uniref:Uncharacterized protein n=1 Tax=Brassica cretica TaxID=69181 RepID=A0ABQ7BQ12_BRACR|nr:hypothetical protein DY000_02037796 [Brassica cretica]
MVNFLWTIRTCPHDGHQGFGQRVMDGRTMMDIKETTERSYGYEEASTVDQVENDDIKITEQAMARCRDGVDRRDDWFEASQQLLCRCLCCRGVHPPRGDRGVMLTTSAI